MKVPLKKLGAVASVTAILTVGALALNPRLPALASAQTITYHADGSANDVSGLHPGTWIGCVQGYQAGHTGADGDSSFAFMPFPCLPNSYVETDIEVGTFGTDPATIDFWFRGNSGSAGQMNGVLGARAYCDNPPEGWWDIRVGTSPVANNPPGTIIVEFGGSSYLNVIGQTNVMDGEWHHILVNRSDTGVSINVDGAPDGAASGPASPINPSVPMTIGRSACEDIDGTQHPWASNIDEINITRGNPGIGPPTGKNQCKNNGWSTFNVPRSFKNQGDCIQFVNTGK
ncbi:MAG TPA: LamG-like jellyroll fold domain-containing protein [Vicinamibacterales bacterium]|nr:LamG-like jellyroll fold domain-containing protein [Vicinamibacterales bacterium]